MDTIKINREIHKYNKGFGSAINDFTFLTGDKITLKDKYYVIQCQNINRNAEYLHLYPSAIMKVYVLNKDLITSKTMYFIQEYGKINSWKRLNKKMLEK